MTDDGYNFWRARVAGDTLMDTPINEPQFGFWLRRFKNRPPHVVAIFPSDGTNWGVELPREGDVIALPWDTPDPQRPNVPLVTEMWPYISQRPVTTEQWNYYKQHRRLPEDIGPGHNEPPVTELLADQIHSAAEEAMREIAGGIDSQLQADRAANHRDRMLKLREAAETARKAEKEPHIAAGRAVDDLWRPSIAEADNAVTFIRNALTPYLRAVREAAEKASPGVEVKAKAGTGKRRTGLRVVKSAKVVDWEAAAIALLRMDSPYLKEEIQRLANKILAAGGKLAGCELIERDQAQ